MDKQSLAILLGAVFSAALYYFIVRSNNFINWIPLLDLIGLFIGIFGFIGFIAWNALFKKMHFLKTNAFLSIWMLTYMMLKVFIQN